MRSAARTAVALSILAGCDILHPVPPDQFCKEAGYAIAGRTFECTDDHSLANARYEAFAAEYTCTEYDLSRPNAYGAPEKDLFHCGLSIDSMTCDEVAACGDDIGCYLGQSPTCALVVEEPVDTGGAS